MALRIVRRWSWVPLVAGIAGLQGCFSTGDDDDSSGCSKDTECRDGRVCKKGECVDDSDMGAVLGGSSGSGGSSASGGTVNGSGGSAVQGKGGSSATGGSSNGGTSNGGTGGSSSGSANGGSGSGSGGTGGSAAGTGGTSGTSGTGTCSEDDPATCPTADSMTFCSSGELVTYECPEYCDALGFPTGACAVPDGCACDFANPTDEACLTAMYAFCGCFDGTATPCVDELDPNDPDSIYFYRPFIYATCHGGSDGDMELLRCIGQQAMLDPPPTCQVGFEACGIDTGAAGAGG